MGARQSKRSVDISAGATKTEKGPSGEPLENGTITTASADEKQAVEANGGVEETPKQNGSTPHVDEKVLYSNPMFDTIIFNMCLNTNEIVECSSLKIFLHLLYTL